MVKGDIVRIKSGRFIGIEGKVVERKAKSAQFGSIYVDRLRNFVHVGITVELVSRNGEPIESYFYIVVRVDNLERVDKKRSSVYNGRSKGDSPSRIAHNKFLADLEQLL